MVSCAILSNFFEEQWTQNHPQYLSGLPRALLPTIFLEIAVYGRKTSHEGPFKMSRAVIKRRELGISSGYSKYGPGYFQRKIQCRRKAWKIKVIFIISKILWWHQVLQWQTTLISLHLTYNYSIKNFVIICSQILSVSNEIRHFTSFMTCTSCTIQQGPPLMTTLFTYTWCMYSPNEMQVHQLIADEIKINWDAVELCDNSYNHTPPVIHH